MVEKRGIIIWIFAFATFLAILASVAMSVLLINEGASSIVRPYIIGDLIGSITGDLSVESYLWISVVATFIFLGVTCLMAFRKPLDAQILSTLLNVGENLEDLRTTQDNNLEYLRTTQENTLTELSSRLERNLRINKRFFSDVNSKVEDANKEMLSVLESQGRAIKKAHNDLVSSIENKADETLKKLSTDLKEQQKVMTGVKLLNKVGATALMEQGKVMMGVKQLSQNGATALNKQGAELKEIKARLEKIEEKIMPIQAKLKSLDDPEDIKGIGPTLGNELRGLGITSVGEFLTTDPTIIGEKTRVSQEMAYNLQTFAQLLMIPGIDENDAELIMDAGIKSRKELAVQDLIQFSKKVGEIAKIYVDEGKISKDEYPTIEEIYTWIRMAT